MAAGLYALPNPGADACPEGEAWTCVQRFEVGEDPEDGELVLLRDGFTDQEESQEESGEVDDESMFSIASGELTLTSGSEEWVHDLLTDTQWSYDEIRESADGEFVVVTFGSSEYSTAAPRVMQPQPARIQILDVGRTKVVFDEEYPAEIDGVEWTADNRLVLSSGEGTLTVFDRP